MYPAVTYSLKTSLYTFSRYWHILFFFIIVNLYRPGQDDEHKRRGRSSPASCVPNLEAFLNHMQVTSRWSPRQLVGLICTNLSTILRSLSREERPLNTALRPFGFDGVAFDAILKDPSKARPLDPRVVPSCSRRQGYCTPCRRRVVSGSLYVTRKVVVFTTVFLEQKKKNYRYSPVRKQANLCGNQPTSNENTRNVSPQTYNLSQLPHQTGTEIFFFK